jgi:transcriptional regulator GlxA family with amidase domain
MDMDAMYEQLWDAVAKVRDASPRVPNDASTDDIVEAVLAALEDRLTRPQSQVAELAEKLNSAERQLARVRRALDGHSVIRTSEVRALLNHRED